ncbi:MAG TPA: MFS transporter [Candidatus Binatia bacterium]|nr:MFS transporter [Candidatus Binatia bacterium]
MSQRTVRLGIHREHPGYKWVALSNTTLGTLLATINFSILLISLPAIFRGIGVNPLAPGEIDYLLWLLLSYMVVTAVLVVTAGRISDMVGRVRMYNLGFAIFTVGSVLLFFTPGRGNTAALEMILFRVVQAVGGAFLFANAPAILTDAFPTQQRGFALGLNMIAGSAGQLLGLVLGGILAAIDWHLVFVVSVPVGLLGTAWAYVALHETATPGRRQRVDIVGNLLFAAGLIVLLVAITYGLLPYGSSTMGWLDPWVLAGLVGGPLLLAVFVLVERRVRDPMLDIRLFRIRPFAAGNTATLFGSIARGGLQFMLIIWLQGIWLPLHGYQYQDTPLWSGIYMIPLLAGFILLGPLFGLLSDRFGQRWFAAAAMAITAAAFSLLTLLPANFSYPEFAAVLVLMGLGMGGFMSPNTAWIMNSVPAQNRGIASGTRATFQNSGMLLSMAIFFTMVIVGLAGTLGATLLHGLTAAGVPAAAAQRTAALPPTGALFAAFLGYNPVGSLVGAHTLSLLAPAARAHLLGTTFFPTLLSSAFIAGLRIAFAIGAALSVVAALVSLVPGESRAARRRAVASGGEARHAEEPERVTADV